MDKVKTQDRLVGPPTNPTSYTQELHRLRTPVLGACRVPEPCEKTKKSPRARAPGRRPGSLSGTSYVPVDKHPTSPRKTWEARRRQRGREARHVVVSAPVHPKADAPT